MAGTGTCASPTPISARPTLPRASSSRAGHSLYDPKLVSFDDMTGTGFDPRKARGFIDVQALHMWASEKARHVQPEG